MPTDPSTDLPQAADTRVPVSRFSLGGPAKLTLSPEEQLSGDMLVLTTGLMVLASVLWLAVYWSLGQQFSVSISLAFQALSAATITFYLKTRKLQPFAMIQLALILFTPFAMQWSIGNFVTASGVSLWGLIAPVGAVTVLGARQSLPWFFAWLFMTMMAGVFDFMIPAAGARLDMQTVAVFFVLNFAAISLMIYALLWYFAGEKNKLRAQVDLQYDMIRAEKDRSEKLLLNILPFAIAERLKAGEANIAQGHADVTVMFADIVGFTKMTEELSPVETVKILNDVFSMFDEIADKYGVEKIKTIGDAYMAAAGLDSGAQIHYADAVASMAIEMLDCVHQYWQSTGERIELRVGIGTGPVVAGVIGKKKFIFDMWGDTVNVASRMAADADAGAIQVDPTTYRRLHTRFQFGEPHDVEIKGKGRMQVRYLVSRT
jgi:class 3 adenylate cyclase